MRHPDPRNCRGSRSFTLVEVLVVAALVAILAAVLLPALSSANKTVARTQCAQHLRGIGTAIGLYAGDHDMMLPGPVYKEVSGVYGPWVYTRITTLLAPYMGLPSTTTQAYSPLFQCPAFVKAAGANATNWVAYSYCLQTNLYVNGVMTTTFPWGIIQPAPASWGSPNPVKLASISPTDMGNTNFWMMSDYDGTGAYLPSPVHKTYRNRLFFDYHVEAIPVP